MQLGLPVLRRLGPESRLAPPSRSRGPVSESRPPVSSVATGGPFIPLSSVVHSGAHRGQLETLGPAEAEARAGFLVSFTLLYY